MISPNCVRVIQLCLAFLKGISSLISENGSICSVAAVVAPDISELGKLENLLQIMDEICRVWTWKVATQFVQPVLQPGIKSGLKLYVA